MQIIAPRVHSSVLAPLWALCYSMQGIIWSLVSDMVLCLFLYSTAIAEGYQYTCMEYHLSQEQVVFITFMVPLYYVKVTHNSVL